MQEVSGSIPLGSTIFPVKKWSGGAICPENLER